VVDLLFHAAQFTAKRPSRLFQSGTGVTVYMFGNTNPFKPSLNLCGYIPRGLPRKYFCFWAFDAARQFTICFQASPVHGCRIPHCDHRVLIQDSRYEAT
jgi:hypothetical protein